MKCSRCGKESKVLDDHGLCGECWVLMAAKHQKQSLIVTSYDVETKTNPFAYEPHGGGTADALFKLLFGRGQRQDAGCENCREYVSWHEGVAPSGKRMIFPRLCECVLKDAERPEVLA